MTDIFFSYSSSDRYRVQAFHEVFVREGFDIFWDQSLPPGAKWDTWIREHLGRAKSVLVFWSITSIGSENVCHEATIGNRHDKLIPVLLDELNPEQFPMGLYPVQCSKLVKWSGDTQDSEWIKLKEAVDAKVMPLWVARRMEGLQAQMRQERDFRQAAERRHKALVERTAGEKQSQVDLTRERDHALDEAEILKGRIEAVTRERNELRSQLNDMKLERDALAAQRVQEARCDADAGGKLDAISVGRGDPLASSDAVTQSTPDGNLPYIYKPSRRGLSLELRLGNSAIEWSDGSQEGRIFYEQIAEVLLRYSQEEKRRVYFTELWSREGMQLSFASVSFERGRREYKDGAYGVFVRELHRRIARAGAPASLETGKRPVRYRTNVLVMTALSIGLLATAILLWHTANVDERPLSPLIFSLCAGMACLAYWRFGRPGRYQPEALPEGFVPRAY